METSRDTEHYVDVWPLTGSVFEAVCECGWSRLRSTSGRAEADGMQHLVKCQGGGPSHLMVHSPLPSDWTYDETVQAVRHAQARQ